MEALWKYHLQKNSIICFRSGIDSACPSSFLPAAPALSEKSRVTHGLFTGSQWQKLWEVRVKRILCTDTVALRKELEAEPIETISAIPLMQRQLKEVDRDAPAIY